ncbi:MAG: hypothetical protein LPK45_11165 [Bacteroidota bacterium]|nr:hypothetical protein [Bacteroidota bacterium]MDX5431662.1 hypothetical protein [Bacteroidota bacterium]MDX5470380.1 hypothetical protein [Bacteroidota bacterium]
MPQQLVAQKTVRLNVVKVGEEYVWSLDVSDIKRGEKWFVSFSDDSLVTEVKEIVDHNLVGLQEYSIPRFRMEYDTFDCLQRTLLERNDSFTDNNQLTGRILEMGGLDMPPIAPVRGELSVLHYGLLSVSDMGTDLPIRKVLNSETKGVLWLEQDGEMPEKGLLLQWRTKSKEIPSIILHTKQGYESAGIFLFAFSSHDYLLTQDLAQLPGTMELPHDELANRPAFQDKLMKHWLGNDSAQLIYSWDLGTEAGNKCDPCTGAPPDYRFLEVSGLKALDTHLFFTALVIPSGKLLSLQETSLEKKQWVFVSHVEAKGFLMCEEAQRYRQWVAQRKEQALLNLKSLLAEE